MAINIQNIVSQINTRLSSADSNSSQSDILRLMKLADEVDNSSGVLEYQFTSDLPIVDSSVVGKLAYIRSANDYADSAGEFTGRVTKFYFAKNDSDGWSELDMQIESQLDSDYQAYLNANAGSGPAAWTYNGSTQGHQAGGLGPPYINVIQKFPFSVDAGTTTDVGDLTRTTGYSGGWSNTGSYGYNVGGYTPVRTTIDKYSLTSDENATASGDLNQGTGYNASSVNSETYGYVVGAYPGYGNQDIQRWPFASEGNSIAMTATLEPSSSAGMGAGGHHSTDYGYASGGRSPTYLNRIEKYSFVSDDNSIDVGNLTAAVGYISGSQSATDAYALGGLNPGLSPSPANDRIDSIDKWPFSSDTNATDVASLNHKSYHINSNESQTDTFATGGQDTPRTIMQKFTHSSDARSTMTMTLGTTNFAAGNGANS